MAKDPHTRGLWSGPFGSRSGSSECPCDQDGDRLVSGSRKRLSAWDPDYELAPRYCDRSLCARPDRQARSTALVRGSDADSAERGAAPVPILAIYIKAARGARPRLASKGPMLVDEVIEIIWPMSESGTKRIPANRFLNQDCAFVLGLESMLLRDPPQNPFSTASVKLRSHGSLMARPVYLQQRTYLMSVARAVECQKQSLLCPAAAEG